MSVSQTLLEVKYKRAMAFGEYLDQHPDQSPLMKQLQQTLTMYRVALHVVLQDRLPKPPRKKRAK